MMIRKLEDKLLDSFLVSGSGFGNTWSTEYCLIRIDYIFLSQEFTIYSHEVADTKASDHYPVVVRVSLDEGKKEDEKDSEKDAAEQK